MTTQLYRFLDWELAEPGNKPVSEVEIDYGHYLSKYIVSALMANDSFVTDLVDTNVVTNNGATFGFNNKGTKFGFDGNDYIQIAETPDLIFSNDGLSILNINRFNSLTTDRVLCSKTDDTVGSWAAFYLRGEDPSDVYQFSVQDKSTGDYPYWRAGSVTPGEIVTIAVGWEGKNFDSSDCSIAIDGELQSPTYIANGYGSTFVYSDNNNHPVELGAINLGPRTKYHNGDINLNVLFNRRLLDSILVDLTLNPYQFLKFK